MTTVDHKYVIVVGYLTDSGVIQCFGPFDTEELANEALDYLKTWDSVDLGGSSVEVKKMTPLPPFTDQQFQFKPGDFVPKPPLIQPAPMPYWQPHVVCRSSTNAATLGDARDLCGND